MVRPPHIRQSGITGEIKRIALLNIIVVITLLSFDVPTFASDQTRQGQGNQDMQKIMGTIKKTEKVETEGRSQQSLVVQLKTQEEEHNITVDLGSVEDLKKMSVQVGNRITVWGRSVDIGDKPIFMANRLQTNDGIIDIQRQRQSDQ